MKARLIVLSLLTVAAVGLSSMAGAGGARGDPGGPPDTSVAAWDAIGVQAFGAAGLSPGDGAMIFSYSAIAVSHPVMLIAHALRPSAHDVGAPAGASAEAAVAAAAHRIFAHYLPAQSATILDPAYTASLAAIPDGSAKADGVAAGEKVAGLLI